MSVPELELVPDDHSASRERIEKLLQDQAKRERILIDMVKKLEKKLDFLNKSMPLTEEERLKNRAIRMYAMKGTTSPFFSSHH